MYKVLKTSIIKTKININSSLFKTFLCHTWLINSGAASRDEGKSAFFSYGQVQLEECAGEVHLELWHVLLSELRRNEKNVPSLPRHAGCTHMISTAGIMYMISTDTNSSRMAVNIFSANAYG